MRGHFVGINVLERPPCVAMALGLEVFDKRSDAIFLSRLGNAREGV